MTESENKAKNDPQPKAVAGFANPRDYREADQTADFDVNMVEKATVKPEDTKAIGSGGKTTKKGKKGGKAEASSDAKRREALAKEFKPSYDLDSPEMRRKSQCANCLNPLTMTKKVNKHELEDKKAPKTFDGKGYRFRSPGAAEGKFMSPLCDDCEVRYQKGENVDFKHALVIDTEGNVRNMAVSQLDYL